MAFPTDIKDNKAGAYFNLEESLKKDGNIQSKSVTISSLANIALPKIFNGTNERPRLDSEGNFIGYLKTVKLRANKDCSVVFSIIRLSLVSFTSVAQNVSETIDLKAGETYTYTHNNFVFINDGLQLELKAITDTTGNFTCTMNYQYYEVFNNLNHFASKTIFKIGDSITKGFGTTRDYQQPYRTWGARLYKYFYDLDSDIRVVNKAIPGAIAKHFVGLANNGYLNITRPETVRLVTIALGTNEDTSGTELDAYKNDMTYIINFVLNTYQNAIVLAMSPVRDLNAGKEGRLEQGRQWLQSHVSSLSNERLMYINMALAVNWSDPQYGLTTSEIHPNEAGHLGMFEYLKTFFINNNIKI